MLGGFIGVVLAVVLVANGMGSEYGWNTIRPYLLCSESRSKMFASKLIADAIFVMAGMIIGVITVILLGVLFTAIRGYSWNLGASTLSFTGSQLLDFTRTFYVILPYALLAFLFTVLGRSTAAGIGFGIGASVLETIITGLLSSAHGWLAKIPDYLLSINVSKITSLSGASGGGNGLWGTEYTDGHLATLVCRDRGLLCSVHCYRIHHFPEKRCNGIKSGNTKKPNDCPFHVKMYAWKGSDPVLTCSSNPGISSPGPTRCVKTVNVVVGQNYIPTSLFPETGWAVTPNVS
jgi:hypothetical protein